MYQDVGHCHHIIKASRSGDYDWLHRPLSLRKNEERRIWEKSRKIYGSPRILEKLKSKGEAIGKHRVARIMRENGIQGAARKKFKPQTKDSNHKLPVADRIFETENTDVQVQRPNQYWGGDITYISTKEG